MLHTENFMNQLFQDALSPKKDGDGDIVSLLSFNYFKFEIPFCASIGDKNHLIKKLNL